MAFKTSPGEDYNFQKFGFTTGGSVNSQIDGRARTQEEFLTHAASSAAPNNHLQKLGVRIRLKELRKRYHAANWFRHYSEEVQSIKPGD